MRDIFLNPIITPYSISRLFLFYLITGEEKGCGKIKKNLMELNIFLSKPKNGSFSDQRT